MRVCCFDGISIVSFFVEKSLVFEDMSSYFPAKTLAASRR